MTLLRNELKESGIKANPSIVTDKEGKCKTYTNHLISRQEIKQIESFIKWWNKNLFTIISRLEIPLNLDKPKSVIFNENKARKVLVKLLSCMAVRKIEDISHQKKRIIKLRRYCYC